MNPNWNSEDFSEADMLAGINKLYATWNEKKNG